ncbi:hypothetical protein GQX73_g1366 [Xylaria multiplex]|uniref:Protein kinase domain-containing protein n=1 Tax=Xylaria multiplex TaxID=323545 RepID=A0A7C8N3C3_9PEZI|nr:hypothetical protein GQX73_g1366 [Xylaria multiplex]
MEESKRLAELVAQLRDAENRAREAERRRREEQQRAEDAERGRQEERQRAEREQQRAEREQQRAEREQQRADESEEHRRPTSLDEYIAACHELVFSKLKVETNKALTSRGPITNPRNKYCPTSLKPWSDFLQEQSATFGELYATCSPERRAFENRSFLAGLGRRLLLRPIRDEKTLEYFMHIGVEDPVTAIMDELKKVAEFRSAFDIGNGIIFENHPSSISDDAEEVVAREAALSPPQTPGRGLDLNQLRPDQICVYRSDDEPSKRTMIYISEYKAPHKLTAPHLRLGLRSMNIYKEVVNRKTIPTSADPEARFLYHAERLTAAALTQTYHYMILGGLEFGLLTTGEAIVFLKIDWEEPDTLYYHLAEPKSEAAAHPHNLQSCAAVGQYLAFGLVALGSPGQRREHGQDERERVKRTLRTWTEDFESTLRSIPADERQAPDTSSDTSSTYAPTTYSTFDRRDPSQSSDDESARDLPDTPSPVERRRRDNPNQTVRRSQRILAQRPRGGHEQGRQHCTQRCLLGLVNGGLLDPACPNVASHHDGNDRVADYARLAHPVRHAEWLRLLSQQLKGSLDGGVVKLGIQGARGALFQVTMLAYGYTFACKGTVRAFVKDLEHEAAVYERLRPVQGTSVPVFLGAIDLRSVNRTYHYDHRVDIIYMMFLSWGGCSLHEVQIGEGEQRRLEASLSRVLCSIHQEGVVHKDVRRPNILRNPETGDVMLIDFERASLLDRPRRPLGQLVPNKRVWDQETVNGKSGTGCVNKAKLDRRFADDRAMAKMAFRE